MHKSVDSGGAVRITGGKLRGRMIAIPPGGVTRATGDRVRAGIFNILMHNDWSPLAAADSCYVLDAFAGSGMLAFEALSRGAAHALLWDIDAVAVSTIRDNALRLKLNDDTCKIARHDAVARSFTGATAASGFNLVFMDPPWRKGLIAPALDALQSANLLAKDALIVAEMAKDEMIEQKKWLEMVREASWGDTKVLFLRMVGC